jgi:hypothetical protein
MSQKEFTQIQECCTTSNQYRLNLHFLLVNLTFLFFFKMMSNWSLHNLSHTLKWMHVYEATCPEKYFNMCDSLFCFS